VKEREYKAEIEKRKEDYIDSGRKTTIEKRKYRYKISEGRKILQQRKKKKESTSISVYKKVFMT